MTIWMDESSKKKKLELDNNKLQWCLNPPVPVFCNVWP